MENANGDPVTGKSLSGPIMVCSLLMLATLAWAVYDDSIGQRPWKSYQQSFVVLYSAHLKKLQSQAAAAENEVNASDELRGLNDRIKQEEQTSAAPLAEVVSQLRRIDAQLDSIREPFQDARARLAALTYDLDHAGSGTRLNAEIDRAKAVLAPLETRFNQIKSTEAQLNARQQELTAPARNLKARRVQFLATHIEGLSPARLAGLLRKMQDFRVEIKQIYVPEAAIVDRCESCHLAAREPLTLVAADMGNNPVFTSHPDPALLAVHDPARFGCSLCHNGNGAATSSVSKAHGENADWPWPLFAKANTEAGCLQCHPNDRLLQHAPELNRARDLYMQKGCAGCHRHAEFDREADALAAARREIGLLETQQTRDRAEIDREIRRGDTATNNDEARRHYAESDNLRILVSRRDGRIAELNRQTRDLMRDRKEIGPNLKDARLKLRRDWIPVWLKDPQAFRPGTRMPHFRLNDEEIRAISAFVWQSGTAGPAPAHQPAGDAAKGRELFETRGCMACHATGEGRTQTGGDFAANLSRLGEKAGYDYIVRWIRNPRERTRPWCPREKRDLGPEDYAKHGLPFVFDTDHDTCPNDGAPLQVQNMTVMPNLRLSPEEARDVASYLNSLKHPEASYPDAAAFMDDTRLFETGKAIVGRLGCANCHEIRGFEEAPRVGTELSKESDKPIGQLDFGLLERTAKQEGWYTRKGFFDHKLRDPAVYDKGRRKAPEDKLRMPDIALTPAETNSIATFLLGSVDVPAQGSFRIVPEDFRFQPSGQAKDLQDGWWVLKKYNCMGCHEIEIGQKSALSLQPKYQDADGKEQLPPSLHEEGARVNPDWLAKFLENPQTGVRPYLQARMPAFNFSPRETGILVHFFAALAGQPSPWVPPAIQPLDELEKQMARALFSSRAAPCLRCHLTGDPRHDRTATAPNFLTAATRLKPAWTARWMVDPQNLSPGTAMPAGLFRRDGDRWVFAGETPAAFRGYTKNHVDLLVRYMFQLDANEQRRLIGRMPAAAPVP